MSILNKIDELDVYGEQLTEVLSKPPSSLYQIGNAIVTLFIFVIFLLSYFIKYPDVISSKVTISSRLSPINLVSKNNGKLALLNCKPMELVKKGSVLAVLTSDEDYNEIKDFTKFLDTFNLETKEIVEFPAFKSIGKLEEHYINLKTEYQKYLSYKRIRPEINEIIQIKNQTEELKRLDRNLKEQIAINQEQAKYYDSQILRSEKLYREKIISLLDLEKERINRLEKRKELENLKRLRIQNFHEMKVLDRSNINLKLLNQTSIENHSIKLFELVNRCKSETNIWLEKNVIKAPKNGKIIYLDHLSLDQNVAIGTNLFSIIEDDKDVIAKGYLPEHKSGKVQIGQKAIIKLNSFPEKEYGSITGIVSSISDIPVNENYLITIRLPNGLKTSFKKEFPYKASYNGVCNIVTEDLRLVERLFYEVKSVFTNN